MIQFRPFRNDDTPALVEVWRSQPAMRGMMQPLTSGILERYVLSKLYFDREGLTVAEDDGRVIGFSHAGFGPKMDLSWISTEIGVISMVLVSASSSQREMLAQQLIGESETYLRRRGALRIYGGEYYPNSPFYLGLYGGSQMPGVLESDPWHTALFTNAGYAVGPKYLVLQSQLADFRPPVNRQQLAIRRRTRVDMLVDPPPRTWWDAHFSSQHDFTCFQLKPNDGSNVWASATFWDMEPLASSWGVHAAGLLDSETIDVGAEPGAELLLLSEALKQLQAGGVTIVETQVRDDDTARLKLMTELNFRRVDAGVVFTKEL